MMITVFISFYLFVIVKTSNDGLQVQTEKIGENVTIKCEESFIKDHQYSFAWFKQSYGKLPQLVVRLVNNNLNVRHNRQFQQRFNATLKGDQLVLNIQETVEEDSGTYFCVRVKTDVTEFGSGTLLIFNEETSQKRTLTEIKVKNGTSYGNSSSQYTAFGETELHAEGDCTGQMIILIWLSIVRTAVVAVMLFIIAVIYSVKKIKK
uniref:Ig-like domain-containing protein n=1 Tax=Astyanax mexicanus TaxID=7994 RepID=A0A3B1JB12_ASTMX